MMAGKFLVMEVSVSIFSVLLLLLWWWWWLLWKEIRCGVGNAGAPLKNFARFFWLSLAWTLIGRGFN